jgi:hypothetical protein
MLSAHTMITSLNICTACCQHGLVVGCPAHRSLLAAQGLVLLRAPCLVSVYVSTISAVAPPDVCACCPACEMPAVVRPSLSGPPCCEAPYEVHGVKTFVGQLVLPVPRVSQYQLSLEIVSVGCVAGQSFVVHICKGRSRPTCAPGVATVRGCQPEVANQQVTPFRLVCVWPHVLCMYMHE